MFGMGFGELLVVLVIVSVVFGPGSPAQTMGHLGKGLQAFRKRLHEPRDREGPQERRPSLETSGEEPDGRSLAGRCFHPGLTVRLHRDRKPVSAAP